MELLEHVGWKIFINLKRTEAHLESSETSKMELFVEIING